MAAEENDLRSQLEAAFAEQKEEPEAPEAPVEAKPDRPRDEHGRFARADKPEVAESPAPIEAKADEKPAEAPAQPEVQQPEAPKALAPPNGWTAEAKAKWHELPPEIQAAVNQREQDVHKQFSKMDEERHFGREMHRVVSPYLAQIQAEGGTPQGAVQSLLNTAYVLRNGSPQQKQQALLSVAKEFNIDLPAQVDDQTPPEYRALQERLAQLEGSLHQQTYAQQQATQATIQSEIQAFASDPEHTHFEEVKAEMAALLQSGRAPDLKSAYDMACWARPDIRTTLLAQQRASEEQKRREEQARAAAEARSKSVSPRGSGGVIQSAVNPNGSLREQLTQAFRASQSSAV